MISFNAAALLLVLGFSGNAGAAVQPDALALLTAAAGGSSVAYEAEFSIEGSASAKSVSVRYAPPGRYRREVQGVIVVSDGKKEWVYDRARGKVWEGDPQAGSEDNFGLLAANYELGVSTAEAVAGRPAWRIDIRSRSEARLSRSIWIDRRYTLILRSESYRPDGCLLARSSITRQTIPAKPDPGIFEFKAPAGVKVARRADPDLMAVEQAKGASGLDPKTPSWLPSGYIFESLDVLPYRGKKIIHYRYSDGVNVLSIFQCPPRSRLSLSGKPREKVRIGSSRGFLSWSDEGNVVGWTADRAKLVLVGPLSLNVLKKIAESVR